MCTKHATDSIIFHLVGGVSAHCTPQTHEQMKSALFLASFSEYYSALNLTLLPVLIFRDSQNLYNFINTLRSKAVRKKALEQQRLRIVWTERERESLRHSTVEAPENITHFHFMLIYTLEWAHGLYADVCHVMIIMLDFFVLFKLWTVAWWGLATVFLFFVSDQNFIWWK